jgi:RNA polymerase sigma-70 factor, ECF subfamily
MSPRFPDSSKNRVDPGVREEEDERDRRLVSDVLSGNREAFRGLVERHQSRVFHLARSLVRNPSDASDIAQETFVRAYTNLKSYRSEGSFTAWVAKIANNLAIDFLRRQKTQAPAEFDERLAETETEESQAGMLSGRMRSDPQAAALRRELGEQLEAALAQLPDKHRAILVLREVDGLSYEELAQTLEIPVGTVMSRLFHARAKMQTILSSYANPQEPERSNVKERE